MTYTKEWQEVVSAEFDKNIDDKSYLGKIKKDLENKSFDIRTNNCPSWNNKDDLEKILEKEIQEYIKQKL